MLRSLEDGAIAKLLEGTSGETRNLEFKTGFCWELNGSAIGHPQARTIKSVLGFANTRDGGTTILGIDDDGHSHFTYTGVTAAMIQSFEDYEQVQQQLDSFADGPMVYEMGVGEYDGKKYIVISVSEFADIPVLCTKDVKIGNKNELVKGDMYVRSMRAKPSTIKATNLELREIIRLAHKKDRDAVMELVRAFPQPGAAALQPGAAAEYEAMDEDL